MHENRQVIERSEGIINEWLSKRGVALSEEKTLIVHSTEGFDFLGFNVRHYENENEGYIARKFASKQGFKLLIKPSNNQETQFKDKRDHKDFKISLTRNLDK